MLINQLTQDFYYLHTSEEFNNLIQYSFGFHGYINNIIGINENIRNKLINKTKYTNKNKVKFNKIYHPSISNECMIKHCKLVVTITGTSGLEAVLSQKPAIILANTTYSQIPSVYYLKNFYQHSTLLQLVKDIKNNESLLKISPQEL